MGNLHLVTGYTGTPHVTAEDHGMLNSKIFGNSELVFSGENEFAALVVSNNCVRISGGELMMQGRHVRLDAGAYVDLTIENGASGYKRNDLIVARYAKSADTGVESCDLVVIKGTASTGTAEDPEYSTGDVLSGEASEHDMPLYRVVIDGLNVTEVEALFTTTNDLLSYITALEKNKLPKSGGTMTGQLNMSYRKITQLAFPTADQDAANKGYVDDSLETPLNRLAAAERKITAHTEALAAIPKIQYGTATIEYDTSVSNDTAVVTFPEEFSTVPVVLLSQPFNTANITLSTEDVTKSGFTAVLTEIFTTTGTKDFMWVAIGT